MAQQGAEIREAAAGMARTFESGERGIRTGRASAQDLAALGAARQRLRNALSAAQPLFRQIEETLAAPGLDAQRERWHAARRRIESRAGALAMWAEQLEAAMRAGDQRAADGYLELARGSLGVFDEAVAEPARAIRLREADERPTPRLSAPAGRGKSRRADEESPPTAADLAETKLVQLTPEIRAKANELGKSPSAIARYVRENFDHELYYGFMQGSAGVYWSGRGNAWDLSAFVIAHMRAAGVPARFVVGFVSMPYETAMAWLGTTNKAATDRILRAITYVEAGEKVVKFDHVWAEAYVDLGNGKEWRWTDPACQVRQWRNGATLPRVTLDRMKYLTTFKPTILATDAYLDQLRDSLRQSQPGRSLLDGVSEARPLEYATETAWELEELYFEQSEPDAKFQHRAAITLLDPTSGETLAKADARLAETTLGQWSIAFAPATAADAQVIQAFGGLDATPPAAVALTPQIRLDGKVVASGKKELAVGTALTASVDYIRAGQEKASYTGTHTVRAGETAAINFHNFQANDRFIGKRVDDVTAKISTRPDADPDATVRDMLHIAGLRYFHRYLRERQRLCEPLGLRPAIPSGEEAATTSTLEVQQVFDTPFVVAPGRMVLDADGMTVQMYDRNSDTTASAELTNIRQTLGLASSSLEHELWEEVAFTQAVSTTRALQIAAQGGAPIHIITKDNAAAEVAKLQLADANKTEIRKAADNGLTVIAPESPVTLGQWRGAAWIAEDANGYGSFIISRYSGGDTGGNKPERQAGAGTIGDNGTTCGSPVSISNGNMHHRFVDFDLRGRSYPLRLVRTYNSQSASPGAFGYGWAHSLGRSLTTTATNVTYSDESGGKFVFTASSSTPVTYSAPGALRMSLSRDQQGWLLKTEDGSEMRFNSAGRMESLTDWRGAAQTFTYDGRGNLTDARDASGNRMSFRYDGQDRVVEVVDQASRRFLYSYDGRGDLVSSTDPAGNRIAYFYYNSRGYEHNLKQIVYPEGGTLTFEYYGNDRVSRVIDPAGGQMRFFYLPIRGETMVVDERSFATSFTYDAGGNVTRIVRADGGVVTNVYNSGGQLTSRVDEAGYTTNYEYDSRGRLIRVVDPAKASVEYTYEAAFNQLASYRDRKGGVTRFEYDAKGYLTRMVDPLGSDRKYAYNNDGLLTSVTDAEGRVTTFAYDAQGRRIGVTDAGGAVFKVRYDNLGRTVAMVDAAGQESRMEYDANGNLIRIVNRNGDAISYEYDRNGNRVRRTDARGKARRYSFDKLDALAEIADPLGNVTRYGNAPQGCACTSNGALASIRSAAGRTTRISYDETGRVASFADPQGHTGRLWYDPRGNVVQTVDRDGASVSYEYDAMGRLLRRSWSGGEDVFTRDVNGNVLTATSGGATFTFVYDALDRVTSVTDSRGGKSIRYTYDKTGRRTSMTDQDGGVTRYSYDKAGLLASVTNPRGEVFEFRYDAVGRRTGMTLGNGVQAAYEYDKGGRLTALAYRDKAGASIAQWTYRYDAAGNPVSSTSAGGDHAWQYDDLDRVVAATHPDTPAEKYAYDADGNLTSFSGVAMTYDAEGSLAAAGDVAFTYDKRGNPVTRSGGGGTTRYAYDIRSWLTRVETPQGRVSRYAYDASGTRIEKSVDGVLTRYLYDGLDLLAETDASGRTVALYTYGPDIDEPLAMWRGGVTYYYLADGFKNVAYLTDESGKVVQSYAYEAFGRVVAPADAADAATPNPFTFAGRELDPETGLMYFRARYYDPVLGRFLQQDPLSAATLVRGAGGAATDLARSMLVSSLRSPQAAHSYAYAANNPLASADPLGLIRLAPAPYTAEQCGVKAVPCKAGQTPGVISGLTHLVQATFMDSGSGYGDMPVEKQLLLEQGWRELTNQVEPVDFRDICDRTNPYCAAAVEYRDQMNEIAIQNRLAKTVVGSADIPPVCESPGVKCDLKLIRETGMGWDKNM
jgi:RHS repeat-associated protein